MEAVVKARNSLPLEVVYSQQAHNVETTSIQSWYNIKALNQRWIDVVSTLYAHLATMGGQVILNNNSLPLNCIRSP